jgi:hypothetical protein
MLNMTTVQFERYTHFDKEKTDLLGKLRTFMIDDGDI